MDSFQTKERIGYKKLYQGEQKKSLQTKVENDFRDAKNNSKAVLNHRNND
jgi:hypothetical protein